MKNYTIVVLLFLTTALYAQHNYDDQGIIFSQDIGIVTIGNDMPFGSYLSFGHKALEVNGVSSSFGLKGGVSEIFLNAATSENNLTVTDNTAFAFRMGTVKSLILNTDGSVSIGTSENPEDYKLAVGGKLIAEAVRVELQDEWPDYVFSEAYELRSLDELDVYIKTNSHLPNIPSSETISNQGIDLGKMQAMQMEKIEELTLYVIALKKEIDVLKSKLKQHED